MHGIPIFKEINDLHKMTGSTLRTSNHLFHCFDMANANSLSITETKPHRANLYTLALNFGTQKLNYSLNKIKFIEPENFILCVAPGHVAKWEKKGDWFGYCTFFKSEFLHFNSEVNFLQQYPFFNINETNLLSINEDNFSTLSVYFQQVIQEQKTNSKFSEEIIRSVFQAILWQVRRIYEESKKITAAQKAGALIAAQFQYQVNEYFLDKIAVEEYAQLLNITPNHLSQTIKEVTGKSAKDAISERRLNEAKYLLAYTNHNIAEIAYYLRFSESTHFIKFFKKLAHITPRQYRLMAKNK